MAAPGATALPRHDARSSRAGVPELCRLHNLERAVQLAELDADEGRCAPRCRSCARCPASDIQVIGGGEFLPASTIAERLIVTERAAAAHVENILDKLGISSRAQIAVWASEHGPLTARSN